MRWSALLASLVTVAAGCSSNRATTPHPLTAQPLVTVTVTTSERAAPTTSAATTTTSPPGTASAPTTPHVDPNGIRVTIATGCPPSVAGHPDYMSTGAHWIVNPNDRLADTFVPGQPVAALICRYAALNAVTVVFGGSLSAGDLFSSIAIGSDAARLLARKLNAIVPWDFSSACNPTLDNARYTAIVFAIPDQADVDLWLKDWYGCPEVGNGVRTSGLLVNGQGDDFLAELDLVAPRAPEKR